MSSDGVVGRGAGSQAGSPPWAEAGGALALHVRDDHGERWLQLPQIPGTVVIGRGGDSQVLLHGAGVSTRHCQLQIQAGGSVVVEDLASRNGTRLAGCCVEREELCVDALVEVGSPQVTLRLIRLERLPGAGDDSAKLRAGSPTTVHDGPGDLEPSFVVRLAQLALWSDLEPQRFLEVVLDLLMEELAAEHGVALAIADDGAPRPVALRNLDRHTVASGAFAMSRSIIDEALRAKASVVVGDASSDSRFQRHSSIQIHRIKAAAAIPIHDSGGVVGLVYLDAPSGSEHFQPRLIPQLNALGGLLGRPLRLAAQRRDGERQLERTTLDLQQAKAEIQQLMPMPELVGRSLALRRLRADVERFAGHGQPVLIWGESGVGKELVARALHRLSPRREARMVVLDAGALSASLLESELFGHVKGAFSGADRARPGLFRAAHQGSLLIDGLDDIPLDVQARMLRVLESGCCRPVGGERERAVDVRVIACARDDPRALVDAGCLREDLYFRLRVLSLRVPPLRERREDIPVLVEHLLNRFGEPRVVVEPEALALLVDYSWPGNVRELENLLRELKVTSPGGIDASAVRRRLGEGDEQRALLDGLLNAEVSYADARRRFERRAVSQALVAHGGNVARAARSLQVDRGQLHRMLTRLGLDAQDWRAV